MYEFVQFFKWLAETKFRVYKPVNFVLLGRLCRTASVAHRMVQCAARRTLEASSCVTQPLQVTVRSREPC
eukprot:SAG11_NODE_28585_length_320_cov_0.624434_1_plen_69_part_10